MSPIDTTDHPAASGSRGVPPDDTPEGRRIRSRTTWLLARHDYLQGDSAPQVCDRYGLNESTLRDRARREGWRKVDQPDPDPVEDEVDDADEPVDCAAMADDALLRVRRALKRGRAGEAASWMRLHEKLVRRLAEIEEAELRRGRVDEERGSGAAIGALEAAIRLAQRKSEADLAALNAEPATYETPSAPRAADPDWGGEPDFSHPSHSILFDDDPADDIGAEGLDPP